jgi:uncharacterized protein YndB with AHSA1/START domain
MPHPFEIRKEIEIAATPEEVWEAVATGPGIDGWFLGTGNQVEPRLGGRVVIDFGGAQGLSTVTAWEPLRHFAHRGDPAPDGSLHAFDFEIEGRGGSTVVRIVHSGFLADDWEAEYDSLNEGDAMYWHQIAQYVTHFRGRTPVLVSLWRPDEPDRDRVMAVYREALGLDEPVREGDRATITVDGLPRIDGAVDFVSPSIIGVRTDDALYRFTHTPQAIAFIGHRIYRADVDLPAVSAAWQAWLDRSFAKAAAH